MIYYSTLTSMKMHKQSKIIITYQSDESNKTVDEYKLNETNNEDKNET